MFVCLFDTAEENIPEVIELITVNDWTETLRAEFQNRLRTPYMQPKLNKLKDKIKMENRDILCHNRWVDFCYLERS